MRTTIIFKTIIAAAIAVGLYTTQAVAQSLREELTISDNVATFNPIEERADSSLTCDLRSSLAGGLETETDPPAVAEDSLATADSVARVRRWRDEFYVRDHLGNVRVVVDLAAESPGEFILERNDYLPFGTRAESDNLLTMESNRYRYAGKEEQRPSSINGSLDLGLVDFGARMYDPSICRWTSVDPLAHRYPGMTPYGYCGGDPVNYTDPDGLERRLLVNDRRKAITVEAVYYFDRLAGANTATILTAAELIKEQGSKVSYTRNGENYKVIIKISVKNVDNFKGIANHSNVIQIVKNGTLGYDKSGSKILALTTGDYNNVIKVENAYKNNKYVIAHEMLHALGAANPTEDQPDRHSKSGLMTRTSNNQSEALLVENIEDIIEKGISHE